jgi:hypothetical protein
MTFAHDPIIPTLSYQQAEDALVQLFATHNA